MDNRDAFDKRGFSGGWIARADLLPLTDAEATARAIRVLPRFEEKLREAERDLGAGHPMTLHYRELLSVQRRLADGR